MTARHRVRTSAARGADINMRAVVTRLQTRRFNIGAGQLTALLFGQLPPQRGLSSSATVPDAAQCWALRAHRQQIRGTRTIKSGALTSRRMAGSHGRGARVRTLVPSRILPDASLLKPTAAACLPDRGLLRVGAGWWMRAREVLSLSPSPVSPSVSCLSLCLLSAPLCLLSLPPPLSPVEPRPNRRIGR